MTDPSILSLEAFVAEARKTPPIPTAIIDATERNVIEAAVIAAKEGIITPILYGPKTIIEPVLNALGTRCCQIVHADTPDEAAEKGVEAVKAGQVRMLMKGHIHTADFLHPIIRDLRQSSRISHVFATEIPTYHKLLLVTDAAINISPNLMVKAAILQNAIDTARLLGIERPKAAALSAIEVINPQIPSTIDAACLSKMAQRKQIHGAIVDGPLAFDNAISAESAAIKQIDSPVAGDVDILLTPDLVSGNILYKDLEYLGSAKFAGVVIGAKVPAILTSRSGSAKELLTSASFGKLIDERQQKQKKTGQ